MRVDRVAGVDLPQLQDRAVTVEQVRHTGGEGAAFTVVDQNAEFVGEPLVWIGDERVSKPFLFAEFGVSLRRVHTRADDLDAGFAKLLMELVEAPGLTRSAPSQRRRIEEDDRHSRQRRRQPMDREAVTFFQPELGHPAILSARRVFDCLGSNALQGAFANAGARISAHA
jgi:hypothetical protein